MEGEGAMCREGSKLNPCATNFQPSAGSDGSAAIKAMSSRLSLVEAALEAQANKPHDGATVVTREGQGLTRAVKESLAVVATVERADNEGGARTTLQPPTVETLGSAIQRASHEAVVIPSRAINEARDLIRQCEECVMTADMDNDMARAMAVSLAEKSLQLRGDLQIVQVQFASICIRGPIPGNRAVGGKEAVAKRDFRLRAQRKFRGEIEARMVLARDDLVRSEQEQKRAEARSLELEQTYKEKLRALEEAVVALDVQVERERCNDNKFIIHFGDSNNDAIDRFRKKPVDWADTLSTEKKVRFEDIGARATVASTRKEWEVQHLVVAADGCIEVVANDGETGLDSTGGLVGPDGRGLRRRAPLSDQQLLERRRTSVLYPVVPASDKGCRAMRLGKVEGNGVVQNQGAMVVDSGATMPMLTKVTADAAGLTATGLVRVRDAQGNFFGAAKAGKGLAWLKNRSGHWVREVVANTVLVGEAVAENLFSLPALKMLGWGMRSELGMDGDTYLTSPAGVEFPLAVTDDGRFFIDADFGEESPAGIAVKKIKTEVYPRAAAAVLRVQPRKTWGRVSKVEQRASSCRAGQGAGGSGGTCTASAPGNNASAAETGIGGAGGDSIGID